MRIKVLIPDGIGASSGALTLQEVDVAPKVGDVVRYEEGTARLIEFVIPAGDDPDGADFVCRAAHAPVTILQGRNVIR